MALDLNEYIKMSYERPNRKVLEGLGASEDLIEYLEMTPYNTNISVVKTLSEGGSDTPVAEGWLTVDGWTVVEEDEASYWTTTLTPTDLFTEDKMKKLLNKYFLYNVRFDDVPLYYIGGGIAEIMYVNSQIQGEEELGLMFDENQGWIAISYNQTNLSTVYFTPPSDDVVGDIYFLRTNFEEGSIINGQGYSFIDMSAAPGIDIDQLARNYRTRKVLINGKLLSNFYAGFGGVYQWTAKDNTAGFAVNGQGTPFTLTGFVNYEVGPTDEVVVTVFSTEILVNATFYDAQSNLMDNLSYTSYDYSIDYTNPEPINIGDGINLPNKQNEIQLSGYWLGSDGNQYSPGDNVELREDMTFTFYVQ